MNNTFPTEENLSGLNRKDFQKDIDDKQTDLFILRNKKGMEVAVTNYGCAILSIMVPDKNGKYANVILGHDSIDHVINSPEPFLSTTIGRYGNRIAKGKFTLYAEEHSLTINNGPQLRTEDYPCFSCHVCGIADQMRRKHDHLQLRIGRRRRGIPRKSGSRNDLIDSRRGKCTGHRIPCYHRQSYCCKSYQSWVLQSGRYRYPHPDSRK